MEVWGRYSFRYSFMSSLLILKAILMMNVPLSRRYLSKELMASICASMTLSSPLQYSTAREYQERS